MSTDIVDFKRCVVTGHGIVVFRLLSLKGRLGLEIGGMKCKGQSAYAFCKERYGFKGTKAKVYDQLCALIQTEAAKLKPGEIETR